MKIMETCNGKINFQGRCDRCGQHAMSSSAYCLRTIEPIPASSGTNNVLMGHLDNEEIDVLISHWQKRIAELQQFKQ